MKNIFKIVALGAVLVFSATSCEKDANNVIDQVVDGVTNGAVLRTIMIVSNEIPLFDSTASFEVIIEEQDAQEGGLLESVDVYLTFVDGSPDEGDSSAANTDEVFIRNIPASEFSPGPFGLPRTTYVITVNEMLAAVGLGDVGSSEEEAIFGGDTFTTRMSLVT